MTLSAVATREVPGNAAAAYEGFLTHVWLEGGGLGRAEIEQQGAADGLGCIRRVSLRVREEITETSRPQRLVYTVRSGLLPFKQHRGELTFQANAATGTTTVTWRCDFEAYTGFNWAMLRMINWSFGRMLSFMHDRMVEDVAAAAPAETAATGVMEGAAS